MFHKAVTSGCYEEVAEILDKDAGYINQQDETKETGLHIAVADGKEEITSLLLKKGAGPNYVNNKNETVYHKATLHGRSNVLQILLESEQHNEEYLNMINLNNETPLHIAVYMGNEKMVQALIEANPKTAGYKDIQNQTVYHAAVLLNNISILQLILKHSPTFINEQDGYGDTALHLALNMGNDEAMKILLNANANISIKDNKKETVYHKAALHGRFIVLQILLESEQHNEEYLNMINLNNETPLHIAVYMGNEKMVQTLLEANPKTAGYKDIQNQTVYHAAVLLNNISILQLILKHSPTFINEQDGYGDTALHLALNMGNEEAMKVLLNANANISIKDNKKETVYHKAILQNKVKAFQLLLEHDNSFINEKDDYGNTSLHLAVINGNAELIKLLLGSNVDIFVKNARNKTAYQEAFHLNKVKILGSFLEHNNAFLTEKNEDGDTMIHLAGSEGNKEKVMLLLKAGAEPKERNEKMETAYNKAFSLNKLYILKILLDCDKSFLQEKDANEETLLHMAVAEDNGEKIKLLLEEGADITIKNNADETAHRKAFSLDKLSVLKVLLDHDSSCLLDKDKNGNTMLHIAVCEDKPEKVKLILKAGGSLEETNKDGDTAYNKAILLEKPDVLETILEHDSSFINKKNKDSETMVHIAVSEGKEEMVMVLLKANVDLGIQNNKKETVYHKAVLSGNRKILQLMLEHGKSFINKQNGEEDTPLHLAAAKDDLEGTKLLIKANANPSICNNKKETVYHVATMNSNVEVLKVLFDQCMDSVINILKSQDQNGYTPLHIAVSKSFKDKVQYLLSKDANVDIKDNKQQTVFHMVTDISVLICLMSHKCSDIDARDECGNTPLYYSINNEDCAQLFTSFGAKPVPSDSTDIKSEKVKEIMRAYEGITTYKDNGMEDCSALKGRTFYLKNTSLHLAATRNDCSKLIKKLIKEHGDNANDANESGLTPLHVAVLSKNNNSIHILLKNGALINTTNHCTGKAAIHYAVERDNSSAIRCLLEHNVDVNVKDNADQSALFYALKYENIDIINLLLSSGADTTLRDESSLTPIHHAYNIRSMQILNALLKRTECINCTDGDGNTVLIRAVKDGREQVVRLFLNFRADVNLKNSNGETVLTLAKDECKSIIEEFIETVKEKSYDVMLSYDWDHKEIVTKMKEYLEEFGLKVWMDIDHLEGNMAVNIKEAIDQSKVIVLCITKKYEESYNSQSEFNYIYAKGKLRIPVKLESGFKPEGELALIISSEFCYDLFDEDSFQKNMLKIYESIAKNTCKRK